MGEESGVPGVVLTPNRGGGTPAPHDTKLEPLRYETSLCVARTGAELHCSELLEVRIPLFLQRTLSAFSGGGSREFPVRGELPFSSGHAELIKGLRDEQQLSGFAATITPLLNFLAGCSGLISNIPTFPYFLRVLQSDNRENTQTTFKTTTSRLMKSAASAHHHPTDGTPKARFWRSMLFYFGFVSGK